MTLLACDEEGLLLEEEIRASAALKVLEDCTTTELYQVKKDLRQVIFQLQQHRRRVVRAAHYNPKTDSYQKVPCYV